LIYYSLFSSEIIDILLLLRTMSTRSPSRGWIDAYDEAGNLYLYNPETNDTKWPSPVKKSKDSRQRVEVPASDWQAYADNNGNEYFYNKKSGEVTWQIPVETGAQYSPLDHFKKGGNSLYSPKADSPMGGAYNSSSSSYYAAAEEKAQVQQWRSPLQNGKLRAGWQSDIDPETQERYYYNESTGESQWHTPHKENRSAPRGPSSVQSPAMRSIQSQRSAQPVKGWHQAIDPATGVKYWFNPNTLESQWQTPPTHGANAKKMQTPQSAGSLSVMTMRSAVPVQGWHSAIDPETGAKYWFNPITLESHWATPPPESASRGYGNTPKSVQSYRSAVPVDGWHPAIDPETGAKYWFNPLTLESQWDQNLATPQAGGTGRSSPKSAQSVRSVVPVDGWHSAMDPETGSKYWFNPLTLESQWTTPKKYGSEINTPREESKRQSPSLHDIAHGVGINDDNAEEELMIGKFEKMKKASFQLREIVDLTDGVTVWEERQGPDGGAIFYCKRGQRGGQWRAPSVFPARNESLVGAAFAKSSKAVVKGIELSNSRNNSKPNSRAGSPITARGKDWRDELKSSLSPALVSMQQQGMRSAEAVAEAMLAPDMRETLHNTYRHLRERGTDEEGKDSSFFAAAERPHAVTARRPKEARNEDFPQYVGPSLDDDADRAGRDNDWGDEDAGDDSDSDGDESEDDGDDEFLARYRAHYLGKEDDDSDFEGSAGEAARKVLHTRMPPAKLAKGDERDQRDERPSFDVMFARSVVIKQVYPWTCLVDIESETKFYRNEEDNIFQYTEPHGFQKPSNNVSEREGDNAFDDYEDAVTKRDEEKEIKRYNKLISMGTQDLNPVENFRSNRGATVPPKKKKGKKGGIKKKPKIKKIPDYSAGASVLGLLEPGDRRTDIDDRYKNELHVRQSVSDKEFQQAVDHTQSAQSPDRFLRNDVASLKAMARAKHRDASLHKKFGVPPQSTKSSAKIARRRSIFTKKHFADDFSSKYAAPAGLQGDALQRAVSRAKTIAGFRSGFLFLTHRPSKDDIKSKLDVDNGKNHGLYGQLQNDVVNWMEMTARKKSDDSSDVFELEDDRGGAAGARGNITQDKIHKRDAKVLGHRLLRLATDSRLAGFLATDKPPPKAGPLTSTALDEIELEKHRAQSRRALIVNEMRNQEKAISRQLNTQLTLMDAEHPTSIENEINRRYLLEAAQIQRSNLVMPRSARLAKAYSQVPYQYKSPNYLQKEDIEDLKKQGHKVETATDGSWTVYKIYPEHSSGRVSSVYINHQNGLTQTGEPFDLRCRRSRNSFTVEKWSLVSKILPKASVIQRHNIQMLSDPDGGLLYYNPVYDRYSSNDQFDTHVTLQDVRDTIKSRDKMRENLASAKDGTIVRDVTAVADQKKKKKVVTNFVSAKIAGYKHKIEANVERNILQYPEPNVWAGILLQPRHETSIKLHRAGAAANTITSLNGTPRDSQPKNDLNSPSAGVTPGPRDYHSIEINQNDEPDQESQTLARTSSQHNLARNFIGELTVELSGTSVRPFPAGHIPPKPSDNKRDSNSAHGKSDGISLMIDTDTSASAEFESTKQANGKEPMAMLIQEQQSTLAQARPANLRYTRSMLDPFTIPPISFEEEMDHVSYSQYREFILQLAAEPRNPVTLLTMSNFLYAQKMDDECMAALTRTIEVLKPWNLTEENAAMIAILQSKVGIRVNGEYENFDVMKGYATACPDSPAVLAQVALYYNRLKYIEQAEQLYIAALMLDPLHPEANRGYAHVLIQKSNFNAAHRYFVRVPESSISYSIVKTEMGWLQEMKGADDEAVLLAFKRCLALGLRDRGTSCALYSLGHFFHVRSDYEKAIDFYRRSLLYNPNEHQTLLLLGCLGNLLPQAYSKFQVDAWLRRGLLCQPHGSAKWVALVIYAESIISNFQDLARAEEYLWTAARDSYTKEIWALVSLSHYYQYTRCDPHRAKRLLLWSARGRERARNLKINADDVVYTHNKQFESNGVMASGNSGFGAHTFDKKGVPLDPADDSTSYFKQKVLGEEAALHVAASYACMDLSEWDHALVHARKALLMDDTLGPAHRCMGLLLFREHRSRKQAINHFNVCLELSSLNITSSAYNQYSLRTGAVIMAMEGNYRTALRTMEAACQGGCNNPLGWHTLGIMTYLYGEGGAKANAQRASEFLHKAVELSGGIDLQAMILRGQLLMELGKVKEARISFTQAMALVPSDPILLASLALCLSTIGFKAPYGTIQADYETKFSQMRSMGELASTEDPEELFLAAVTPSLKKSAQLHRLKLAAQHQQANGDDQKDDSSLPSGASKSILKSSPQILGEIPAIIDANIKAATSKHSSENSFVPPNVQDVPPEVLYWYAMYQLKKNKEESQEKAHKYFTRSVQRSDCPPHPLGLYMLGWLSELKGDLAVAERYYCYAVQLDPIDVVHFLKLQSLVKDTLTFVKGLEKVTEKSEVTRLSLLKKKLKMRRKGVSVPIGKEGDETGEQAAGLLLVRRRLLLHERVHKLASLRCKEIGKRGQDLNTPGKCVYIDPFWRERALHAFSECDDWASLLRSSHKYNGRETEK